MRTALCVCLILSFGCGDDDPPALDAGPDTDLPDVSDAGPDAADAEDASEPEPPLVMTTGGPVIGERELDNLQFLTIPYAAPPLGELRFAPPEPPDPWTEPRMFTRQPPRCAQAALGASIASTEDCLFVNVHTPDPLPENAPVIFWIHGGAFIFGEGVQTDRGTEGDLLAREHGVVVVSVNYRLGAFGFLAHEDGLSGNYGLMDQQMALEWTRDNIAAFGGDPNNVTIVGESAGGISVCAHMVSPRSRGLFARAISESGLCGSPLPTQEEMQGLGESLAVRMECSEEEDVIACLRGKSQDELLAAESFDIESLFDPGGIWWINVDGETVPGDFVEQVGAGEAADVPVVMGWNADEGTLFILLAEMAGATFEADDYEGAMPMLAASFGVEEAALRAQYPLDAYDDAGAALADIIGDARLACPSRRAAQALAAREQDVFVYHFTYPDAAFQLSSERELGAFHSAEIQFVFGHPAELGRRSFRGPEVGIGDAMSAYWTAFATDADPADAGGVRWPAFEPDASDEHLIIDADVRIGTGADRDVCELFEAAL